VVTPNTEGLTVPGAPYWLSMNFSTTHLSVVNRPNVPQLKDTPDEQTTHHQNPNMVYCPGPTRTTEHRQVVLSANYKGETLWHSNRVVQYALQVLRTVGSIADIVVCMYGSIRSIHWRKVKRSASNMSKTKTLGSPLLGLQINSCCCQDPWSGTQCLQMLQEHSQVHLKASAVMEVHSRC